jgi:hypothetical protein
MEAPEQRLQLPSWLEQLRETDQMVDAWKEHYQALNTVSVRTGTTNWVQNAPIVLAVRTANAHAAIGALKTSNVAVTLELSV